MKKFLLFFAVLLIAIGSQGQLVTKQFAFGAKGIDSVSGATTGYYYFNMAGTAAAGKVVSTTPITLYQIYSVDCQVIHPLVYTASDSVHLSIEYSNDNTYWFKWTNAGATTQATQTQWLNGGPTVSGAGCVYLYTDDLVCTKAADAACSFKPVNLFAKYFRVKYQRYKATSASYLRIWGTLIKVN
ncbi:MAG: hypothetical protein WCI57_04230 [Candidatus Berkelbacteria bacterium]